MLLIRKNSEPLDDVNAENEETGLCPQMQQSTTTQYQENLRQ